MLEIMERFGWTYEEYMSQPTWVIDLTMRKISVENKISNSQK